MNAKAWVALVASALGVSSCSSVDDKTQVTIALSSETKIPEELDSFAVRVISTRTGELRFSHDYYPTSGREFPTTLAVIPLDGASLDSPLRIELEGRSHGAVFLRRQSVVSYVKGRNILLSMPLRMACFQFKDCGPSSTCAGGQCVPVRQDGNALPQFEPKLVFPEGSDCFSEDACLDASFEAKVESDCSFALPPGVASGLGNVAVRWDAAPSRILALDEGDAQEGWTRTADDRGKLSQGTCDSHFQRRAEDGTLQVSDWAKAVYFSPTCRSKTSRKPYCLSPKTQHSGIGALVP